MERTARSSLRAQAYASVAATLLIAVSACGADPQTRNERVTTAVSQSSPSGPSSGSTGPTTGPATPAQPTAGSAGSSPATSASAALLASARSQLTAMQQSDYQHTTNVDVASGRFDYDCSGFVDYTLGQVSPAALAEIPTSASAGRPLAQDFEAFFSRVGTNDPHWSRVATVPDIRPGDVVSWLVSPDTRSRDTGHVMIAASAPEPDPQIPGAYRLQVVDAVTLPHAEDTRTDGATGLGTGWIELFVDGQGQPTGFNWQAGKQPSLPTKVAIGRLIG